MEKKEGLFVPELFPTNPLSRREFVRSTLIGSGALAFGGFLVKAPPQRSGTERERPRYSLIIVDYNKCTGCRTCEAVCSQANERVIINGEELLGLGNPAKARVKIANYIFPPVDVPSICVSCPDAPCVAACPVSPDPKTGRKALYRDEKTLAVKVDPDRCISCGNCVQACQERKVGIIKQDKKTGKPYGICTLCEGDPQCVKYCPYGALTHFTGDGRHFALPPDEIAGKLAELWYYSKKYKEAVK
jgi:carbon-monoxide dehydrogenase iron sulfur subunit